MCVSDFEELSKEEQEEVTPATSALRPSHSLSKDDMDVRTGSVLEQKLTMELKYAPVAEGSESTHGVVNTVAEGSESVHRVVNTDNTTHPFKTNAHVIDSHDKSDVDIPMLVYDDDSIFDADLNVDITSELTHCNLCSSQGVGGHRASCERASIEVGKHEHSGDRDSHDIAANNDKCGDAGCKYCSRVLNAYYRGEGDKTQLPMTTATDDSLPRMTGLVGVAYSAGTVDYNEPPHNWPTEPISKHSTMTHKSKSFSDVNSALFYSSNYDLPGVLRGGYPTHDYSIVGVKSHVDVPQQETSRQHSHHPSELHDSLNKSVTSGQSSRDDVGAVPISVYEQEDITCRVRTTWQQQADKHTIDTPTLWQQQAAKHTIDTPALWQQQADKHTTDTPAVSPSSTCKMDAQTLSLIRSVASAFQCSPVRRRGIVRRLAKDTETRLSLQSPIPVCPGSKPEVSLPFVCSRMQGGASHDSLVSCRDSMTVLTPDKSPVFVDDGVGAVSHSFTSSRVLQLNTELSQADELTATSESTIETGKKSTFVSSPTDDCRVRNLVEIFEPKDGVCPREPSGANVGIQSSIVKRLTWHAGDKSKPKFDVTSRNAVALNAQSCVESPPGRRRTLSDTWAVPVTGGSVLEQRRRHTSVLPMGRS